MSQNLDLTILIPCLNESKTLADCILKAHEGSKAAAISYEILISDNGSTDGSQEIATRNGARVINAPVRGYGAALHFGFINARGNYILFADADDTYDFKVIPSFWSEVKKGFQIVIGTRIKGTIEKGAMPFLNRYLGTPVLSFLIRNLYKIPITDCNSGMRLLSRDVYDRLKMSSPGMEYASEMLVKIGLLQTPLVEIPITLSPDRRGRPPHLRRWRDGWRHLRFILMYSPNAIFSRPGLILYLLGTAVVLLLAKGPVDLGSQAIDYHSQIAASTIGLIGFTMWGYGQLIGFFSHLQESLPKTSRSVFVSTSLERKLILGTLMIGAGLIFGIPIIAKWVENGFSNLSEVHRLVASLYFISSGFLVMLLSVTLFTFDYPSSVPNLKKI